MTKKQLGLIAAMNGVASAALVGDVLSAAVGKAMTWIEGSPRLAAAAILAALSLTALTLLARIVWDERRRQILKEIFETANEVDMDRLARMGSRRAADVESDEPPGQSLR